jgi:hypothetical protein
MSIQTMNAMLLDVRRMSCSIYWIHTAGEESAVWKRS